MATKTKTFTVPEETLKLLAEYSKKSMIAQSKIVSMLLEKYLKENKHEK